MRHHDDLKRSLRGAVWGLAATVVMTAVMVVGALVFPSSFARPPFPYLFINHLLPHASGAAAAAVTVIAHFAYGSLIGIIFAYFSQPMALDKGVGFGALVWAAMQVLFVPWIGWGDFGFMHASASAFVAYTLVLHLVYGLTLGALGARDDRVHNATFDEIGRLQTHPVSRA